MSISSETNKNTYSGNGSTDTFPYTFKILDDDHILVQKKVTSTGIITTLVKTTDYTVSGVGSASGGNVVLVDPATDAPSGSTIILTRDVPQTQETDYEEYDTFPAASHEEALDKLTMIDQQQQEQIDRSIKVDPAVASFSGQILGTPAAYNQVRVNSGATGLEFAEPTDLGAFSMPAGNGLLYKSATDVAITATLAGTTGQITVTESPTGTFTFSLPATITRNITFSGTIVLPTGQDLTAPDLIASSGVIMTGFAIPPQGRLTLATATPVTTTDQTAKTTIYYTPYVGTRLALYTSSVWKIYNFTELSLAVPSTTSTMYDVFIYDNAGTLTLEATAWTNDTTRATALVYQDGMLVKSGATNRLYLGSFRTTGVSGQTEDSAVNRLVDNYYNKVTKPLERQEATNSWTYSSSTVRQANGSTSNQFGIVQGVAENIVSVNVAVMAQGNNTNTTPWVGIGIDSTTASSAVIAQACYTQVAGTGTDTALAMYGGVPSAGYHYYVWLESNRTNLNTVTWFGDNGDAGSVSSGMVGSARV